MTGRRNRAGVEDEGERVRRARDGDPEAFAALVRAHRSSVEAVVRRRLGAGPDADDAVQETFTSAFRHLKGLEDESRFAGWLRTIAANASAKALARRITQRERFAHPALLEDLAWPDAPEGEAVSARALREALDVLSPEDRAAVTLFHLLGLPQTEIARLQRVPVGTVKSRLHRARGQIGRRWSEMANEKNEPSAEDYGRAVIGGMRGSIEWQRLLGAEGLDGWQPDRPDCWRREGDVLIGGVRGADGARLATGEPGWHDYEISVLVTLLRGGNVQIVFRTSPDGLQYYLFDMLVGWQAVAISRGDLRPGGRLRKLSVINFPFESGREYDVMIAARGASLTSYIDGKLINQVTDTDLESGRIGLTVWQSETAFRDPRVRLLS